VITVTNGIKLVFGFSCSYSARKCCSRTIRKLDLLLGLGPSLVNSSRWGLLIAALNFIKKVRMTA
jgi:hypothetical protein